MNVLLVQPPKPIPPVKPIEHSREGSGVFSPPWNLMCLRAYLACRTRHTAHFVDCRLFSDLEKELVSAVEAVPAPRMMVVNCNHLALGQASAVLEIAKRYDPHMPNALCGEFPSLFPDRVLEVPRVDFALSGDPEPILHNLLDHVDVRPRLRHVSGLIFKDGPERTPHWLKNLNRLPPVSWEGLFLRPYQTGTRHPTVRLEARLSRGHTGLPCDRSFGQAAEPLRLWSFDRFAALIQKCSQSEVAEVALMDPPGIWTPEHLHQFCTALDKVRNIQPWGLTLLPTILDEPALAELRTARCRRVDILFPSCDSDNLAKYGCILQPQDIAQTLSALALNGIQAHCRFWMGGPEEHAGESHRVAAMIRKLGTRDFSIEAFPLDMGSPLYVARDAEREVPQVEDWLRWARDPWTGHRPMALWSGPEDEKRLQKQLVSVERELSRSVTRWASGLFRGLKSLSMPMGKKAVHASRS